MFNWLKKLFGSDVPSTPVIAQEPAQEEVKAHVGKVTKVEPAPELKKSAPKKSTAKPKKAKAEKVDLDSMNKSQLLEEAKKRGIAANASLKKNEILERIKNG
jgi:hypothetical protein